jgi:multicomponent Na+:H+ antiporter subunit D
MWLVDLHSSVSSEISALLSGIAVKTGLYALLRLRPALGNHFEVVPFFAVISAILGVIFAFHEKHYKRILAYSTLSQIGYILIAPETGIFYVFAHGIFKSWLFLGADLLPNSGYPLDTDCQSSPGLWLPFLLCPLPDSPGPLVVLPKKCSLWEPRGGNNPFFTR